MHRPPERCECCDLMPPVYRVRIDALGGVTYRDGVTFDVCQSCLPVPNDGDHIDVISLSLLPSAS